MSDDDLQIFKDDQEVSISAARDKIAEALAGLSKERAAATMGAVCIMLGFYDEAIRFAKIANTWRQALVNAGGQVQ